MKINQFIMILGSAAILTSCGGSNESEGEQYYNQEQSQAEGSESPVEQTKIGADAAVNDMPDNNQANAAVNAEGASFAKGAKLIAMSDCLSCHNEEQRIVGPAYVEVAEKYEFNDKNVDYLAGKIIEGGAGVWGQVAMTPHPDLSREDAREMARYVLNVKKK